MTSGTYSPSLNSTQGSLERKALEHSLYEATSDWSEESQRIDLIASRLALVHHVFRPFALAASPLGTFSNAVALPVEAMGNAFALSTRTFGLVCRGSVVALGEAAMSSVSAANDSLTKVPNDGLVSESPQMEYRGWGDYIEPAEYEARLAAISPRLANNEAEEHVPPTPQGKIQAIPLR